MKLLSGLDAGYWEKDVDEFLALLRESLDMLDTLGQIQAVAGGSSMSYKSGKTFEMRAHLETYLEQLTWSRAQEKREKGRR